MPTLPLSTASAPDFSATPSLVSGRKKAFCVSGSIPESVKVVGTTAAPTSGSPLAPVSVIKSLAKLSLFCVASNETLCPVDLAVGLGTGGVVLPVDGPVVPLETAGVLGETAHK